MDSLSPDGADCVIGNPPSFGRVSCHARWQLRRQSAKQSLVPLNFPFTASSVFITVAPESPASLAITTKPKTLPKIKEAFETKQKAEGMKLFPAWNRYPQRNPKSTISFLRPVIAIPTKANRFKNWRQTGWQLNEPTTYTRYNGLISFQITHLQCDQTSPCR